MAEDVVLGKNEKMMIRSADSVFLNAKAVFVEYIDVIRSPYFSLLSLLVETNHQLQPPFDINPLLGLDEDGLIAWYYARRNRNFMVDLIAEEFRDSIKSSDVDIFLDKQLAESYELIETSVLLNFHTAINMLTRGEVTVTPKLMIYYPYNNLNIRKDIEELYGENNAVEFVYGDIRDILKDFPNDSTYVFSDITNIAFLEECNKLNYASILIPDDYDYNRDEKGNLLLNIDEYSKDYVFKFNRFLASVDN